MTGAASFESAAIEAAQVGGEVLRKRFRTAMAGRVEVKGHHDYVTEVDREAEAAILGYLCARYPDHAVMSEEASPDAARAAAYRWVVDPLDGTTNFVHGFPAVGVSVALVRDDRAVAGAILGSLAGLFFGPIGLLLGPVLGAVIAEWIYCRRLRASLKSGVGTVLGMLLGAVAKFGLALVMIGLFGYWLWRG